MAKRKKHYKPRKARELHKNPLGDKLPPPPSAPTPNAGCEARGLDVPAFLRRPTSLHEAVRRLSGLTARLRGEYEQMAGELSPLRSHTQDNPAPTAFEIQASDSPAIKDLLSCMNSISRLTTEFGELRRSLTMRGGAPY